VGPAALVEAVEDMPMGSGDRSIGVVALQGLRGT